MFFVVMIMVKVVLGIAIDRVAAGMVFLDVWKVGHVAVCLGIGLFGDYVVICVVFVLYIEGCGAAHVNARCGE